MHLQNGGREVTVVEGITDFSDGEHYRHQVFDCETFPPRAMFFIAGQVLVAVG